MQPPIVPYASPVANAPPPTSAPQLSAEHLAQLQSSGVALRKIRRATAVANFDAWTVGVFGAITLVFGLNDFSSIILGGGMIVVAIVELRSAAKFKALDVAAASILIKNQIALGGLLILYAVWHLLTLSHGGNDLSQLAGSDPEVQQMLAPYEGITNLIMAGVYGLLIAIAIFGQGGMMLYYRMRAKQLKSYLAQTPPWIIDMQKAGVAM